MSNREQIFIKILKPEEPGYWGNFELLCDLEDEPLYSFSRNTLLSLSIICSYYKNRTNHPILKDKLNKTMLLIQNELLKK